jgi:hypothetical protein
MEDALALSGRIEQRDKKFVADIIGQAYANHLFIRLIAKGRRFTKIDFKYSIFDACYLRDCAFDSCDFTGCRFIATNLSGSSFAGCKFDYAVFEKTSVDSDLLDIGCPGHENLKMRFARSLRMNYQQLGDARSANKAIVVELQAMGVYLNKAWQSNESYYRKKYSGLKRLQAFLDWGRFKILDWVWGNGESPLKLLRTAALFLIFMAVGDVIAFGDWRSLPSYGNAVLEAPQIFFGAKTPPYPGWWLTTILIVRLMIFGFFMAIIVKRFNRR